MKLASTLLIFLTISTFCVERSEAREKWDSFSFKYSISNIDHRFTKTDSAVVELKSRQRAINMALFTTVGSMIIVPLAPFGLLIGPSAGSIYAGEYGDALSGSLSRLGSISLATIGVFYLLDEQNAAGNIMVWTGFGTLIYSIINHIWFVGPRNVDAYNERIQKKSVVQITPWVGNSNEKYVLGGSLRWSFR